MRRGLPGDDLQALRHHHDARQAARAGQRHDAGCHPGQPRARGRIARLHRRAACSARIDALLGFELPFIVHWEGYHYVVVYGVSKRQVWVADPAVGFKKLSVEEFERGWSGTCLVFTPGQNLVQLAASRSPWVRFARYLKPYKKILAPPVPGDIRDPDAGDRSAGDHPEHPGRRDRAPRTSTCCTC